MAPQQWSTSRNCARRRDRAEQRADISHASTAATVSPRHNSNIEIASASIR
jgi:hypothetical protein